MHVELQGKSLHLRLALGQSNKCCWHHILIRRQASLLSLSDLLQQGFEPGGVEGHGVYPDRGVAILLNAPLPILKAHHCHLQERCCLHQVLAASADLKVFSLFLTCWLSTNVLQESGLEFLEPWPSVSICRYNASLD